MNELLWVAATVGVLATIALVYLGYLLLFEVGPIYTVPTPVHELDERARARLLTTVLSTPLQTVDRYELLNDGATFYPRMLEAIRAARHTVHLEAYIFRRGVTADAVLEALCERSTAGVRVRVVIDAIGSLGTPDRYFARLVSAGGVVRHYHRLRPMLFRRWNNRTHRNLLIVDGAAGYIGGAGIGDQWSRTEPPPWRDCMLHVSGPIVTGLQAVFAENWLECAGELLAGNDVFPSSSADSAAPPLGIVVGSTATSGRSTRARVLIQLMLALARERIDLCTPYFIPDLGIRKELIAARRRGVAVRVITGGPYADHGMVRRAGRRRYGTLLQAGVQIHEYASHMMHAKVLVIDGKWSVLGSTNIDHRSFSINDEVNVAVADEGLAAELTTVFERDLASSERLELTRWRRRALSERLLATLGRVLERHQ